MRGLWTLSVLVGMGIAHADELPPRWTTGVTDADQARANELRAKGDALFAEKSYEPAVTAYRESLAIWDHPVTQLQLAMTLVRLERYAAAADALDAAAEYGNAPFTPEQLNELKSYQKLIAGSVGTIEVYCTQANATLSLDGTPWFTCPATQSRRVDVGDHVIAAAQRGYHERSQTVRIVGGNTARIHVELRSFEDAYETQYRYPTWLPPALVGAGAAVMVGGFLVARSGWSRMDEYDQRIAAECAVNGCDLSDPAFAELDALHDSAQFRSSLGTWTMIGGAVVMATGVVLYFTNTETRRLRVDVAPTGATASARWTF